MAPTIHRGISNHRATDSIPRHPEPGSTGESSSLPWTQSAPALLTTPDSSQPQPAPVASTKSRWLDAFERLSPDRSRASRALRPSPPHTRNFIKIAQTATAAKELIGTADGQFTPGVREYLFPEPIKPLKGLDTAKKLLTGKRGLTAGGGEIFFADQVGRGLGKVLASVVFFPFVLVAMLVDTPRFLGDLLIEKANQAVLKGVVRDDRRGALLIVAGGLGRVAGGLCKMAIPITAILLGCLAGGVPGVVAAVLFETVYFGEDVTSLLKGDFEEMKLFLGLRDIIGGMSIIFGAEYILRKHRQSPTSTD